MVEEDHRTQEEELSVDDVNPDGAATAAGDVGWEPYPAWSGRTS